MELMDINIEDIEEFKIWLEKGSRKPELDDGKYRMFVKLKVKSEEYKRGGYIPMEPDEIPSEFISRSVERLARSIRRTIEREFMDRDPLLDVIEELNEQTKELEKDA